MFDNGPQFSSKEFVLFAKDYGFSHVTSSPGHASGNGEVERAVRTIKRNFCTQLKIHIQLFSIIAVHH